MFSYKSLSSWGRGHCLIKVLWSHFVWKSLNWTFKLVHLFFWGNDGFPKVPTFSPFFLTGTSVWGSATAVVPLLPASWVGAGSWVLGGVLVTTFMSFGVATVHGHYWARCRQCHSGDIRCGSGFIGRVERAFGHFVASDHIYDLIVIQCFHQSSNQRGGKGWKDNHIKGSNAFQWPHQRKLGHDGGEHVPPLPSLGESLVVYKPSLCSIEH